jgi:hypothetical protein
MEHFGREQADAAVMVLGVIPGKEVLAKAGCILDRAEAFRELVSVLQGLDLTFRERVVVGDVVPAPGLGDTQVGQQQGGNSQAAGPKECGR